MQDTRGKFYSRFSYYAIFGAIGLIVYFAADELGLPVATADLIRGITLPLIISAFFIPTVKELVDRIFRVHTDEVIDDQRKAKLLSKYGIIHIATHWKELTRPTGEGRLFRDLGRDFIHESNWYIVSINPKGIMDHFLHETLIDALMHGSKVKWAYLKMPEDSDEAGKTLRDWWVTRYDASMGEAETYIEKLDKTRNSVNTNIQTLKSTLELYFSRGMISKQNFCLYENTLPSTYLAILALRRTTRIQEEVNQSTPFRRDTPGIVLVYPYQMYHFSDENIYGMILGNGGELYGQYASSILRFFYLGELRGHLKKAWPLKQLAQEK